MTDKIRLFALLAALRDLSRLVGLALSLLLCLLVVNKQNSCDTEKTRKKINGAYSSENVITHRVSKPLPLLSPHKFVYCHRVTFLPFIITMVIVQF